MYLTPSLLEGAILLAFEVLTLLVTLATIISALTPTRWDNQAMDRLFHYVNLIAGNVGHNKNADDG
ncbi:hypothetical protein NBZ79_12130 [Sneathiella marina]|uniref:Uncharacterized protein n=1 Tax=Sneathiella marina TaxID=2950108 RepID=A0ABY4VZ98_9PROT|nr:hypothetical protein [Sneathiella marina]USG59924.1 hypothetical protein NBZ79_12130 [Sneathiella marina]